MATFDYPSALATQEIAQDFVARLTLDDPIFALFPLRDVDETDLRWEQLDNYRGLMFPRGVNGEPTRIKKTGAKNYVMTPGFYGEFDEVDEQEILRRRQLGTFGTPIRITDLTTQCQQRLAKRRVDRIRWIMWTLLTTGTFSVPNEYGTILHTDSFTLPTFTAGVTWATSATATPLANFRTVKLNQRGHSVSFGADANAYMNSVTVNNMLSNVNAADLYGRRTQGLGTFNNLKSVNELWTGDLLPTLTEYDEGYYDDAGTFHTFIPDNTVVVIGKRLRGEPLGEFRFTRNAMKPDGAPGPYMVINESERPPKKIRVDDGFNGGPVLFYPSAITTMNV